MTTHVASVGYGQLVRENTNFRYLWFGQIVSLLGDWFNLIAAATLIATLTGSGIAVGGLFVVRMLAPFLASPLAGVAADRYDRKMLLIGSDIARAVVVVGFFFVRDANDVWLLYVLTALQMGLSGVFFPARNAILPDLVSRRELGAANALSSATWSTMLALGTALGGLVAGGFGVNVAFAIDGLSFLVSALILMRISYTPAPREGAEGKGVMDALGDYVDGLRYLRRHADTFATTLHKSAIMLCFASAYDVTAVAISRQVFQQGEDGGIGLGLIYAVVGIGTGVGPILLRRFTGDRERPLRIAIMLSYCIASAGMLIAAPLASFPLFLFGLFWRGFGGGAVWVFATQLLLQTVPDQVRGRVFGTEFAMFTLAGALGALFAGWALDNAAIGIAGIVWLLPLITLIPAALWGYWIWRQGAFTTGTANQSAGDD